MRRVDFNCIKVWYTRLHHGLELEVYLALLLSLFIQLWTIIIALRAVHTSTHHCLAAISLLRWIPSKSILAKHEKKFPFSLPQMTGPKTQNSPDYSRPVEFEFHSSFAGFTWNIFCLRIWNNAAGLGYKNSKAEFLSMKSHNNSVDIKHIMSSKSLVWSSVYKCWTCVVREVQNTLVQDKFGKKIRPE